MEVEAGISGSLGAVFSVDVDPPYCSVAGVCKCTMVVLNRAFY